MARKDSSQFANKLKEDTLLHLDLKIKIMSQSTLTPTFDPTISPTQEPTEELSVNPTPTPTEIPTLIPTANPTVKQFFPTLSPSSAPVVSVSDCFEETFQFVLVTPEFGQTFNFDQAIAACNSNSPGTTLASITNFPTVDFVSDFLSSNDLNDVSETVFFGLSRSKAENLNGVDLTDPSLFTFIDGSLFDDVAQNFAQIKSVPPWRENEPNSVSGDPALDQACAGIVNGEWVDISCTFEARFGLCKRDCEVIDVAAPSNRNVALIAAVAATQFFILLLLGFVILKYRVKVREMKALEDQYFKFIRLE